jgi:hypothetical protein
MESPIETMVKEGGVLLILWIVGAGLLMIVSILIVWSGTHRPRAIPLWLALPNPIILNLLICTPCSFSDMGRSYVVPMTPNLAHLGFFLHCFGVCPGKVL